MICELRPSLQDASIVVAVEDLPEDGLDVPLRSVSLSRLDDAVKVAQRSCYHRFALLCNSF